VNLEEKIASQTAEICVIGLGYVGLPLAVAFADIGFPVTGVDIAAERVAAIGRGESYISDVPHDVVAAQVRAGRLRATTDYNVLKDMDIIFICVPTPFRATKDPDLSFVIAASEGIAKRLQPGQLVILQSTTYPGTTEEVVLPILERTGLRAGRDFHLAFSPERIDPGNRVWTVRNTPKVIGGLTPRCAALTKALLSQLTPEVHVVSTPRAAEMTKLLENTFRSVNIALVNELALLCERMDIDIWEVIEAASTKPFGFMPFRPGPGVGGHCLSPDEYIIVKNGEGLEITPIGTYVERLRQSLEPTVQTDTVTIISPEATEVLTFDPMLGVTDFRPLRHVSARRYPGRMVRVVTTDGRRITVTDGHPMLVWEKDKIVVKRADALQPGDALPVIKNLPSTSQPQPIDLIAELPESAYAGVRVKPRTDHFAAHRADLTPHLRKHLKHYWGVFKYNTMPLSTFVALEQSGRMPISRQDVLLCTGRGSSWTSIPAVIPLDENFARLIGYYLSEGCISEDTCSLRTRFTFSSDEIETIADIQAILRDIGLKFSAYKDRRWNSYHIKVSSRLFGWLLRDILGCGTNSHNMRIPQQLMAAPENVRLALLSGLLRGDGDVHHTQEIRTYAKGKRKYSHYINTATVGYFSASPVLFQQVALLLHSLGFVPTFKRDKPQLRLYGAEQLGRLQPLFADDKRRRLEAYIKGRRKRMPRTQSVDHGNFATVKVREIANAQTQDIVYSIETDEPHTFVTSYGLAVHNCIPVDPRYLSWKAREYDFYTKFIELAAEVNEEMPFHVVQLVTQGLNRQGKPVRGANVLVLGVAFKPDIEDARNSPAERIIELLLRAGAHVRYHDPYVPRFHVGQNPLHRQPLELVSIPLTAEAISESDAVVIATGHKVIDYDWVVQHAPLVIDPVNATGGGANPEKIVRLGAPV